MSSSNDINMEEISNKKSNLRKRKATELRPGIRENIKFKLFVEDEWRNGYVLRVGKASGKDKNSCWISDHKGNEKKVSFVTEVEDWIYIPKKTCFGGQLENLELFFLT